MKGKSLMSCLAQFVARLTTILFLTTCTSSLAYSEDLNSLFDENDTVYVGIQPIEGALPEVRWIFVKNENQQWTLVQNQQFYGASSGPARSDIISLTISGDKLTATPNANNLDSSSFQQFDIYSQEFESNWGSLVASQLQKASEQGLLSGPFFEVNYVFEQIEITSEGDELFESNVTYQEILLIPEGIYTNLEGGWQGPTEIEKSTVTDQTSSKNIVEAAKFDAFNTQELMQGNWAVPFISSISTNFGTEDEVTWLYDLLDFSMDSENTVTSGTSKATNTTYNVIREEGELYYTWGIIGASENGDSFYRAKINITAQERGTYLGFIEIREIVDNNGVVVERINHPPVASIIAKENVSDERFIRGISTQFPFMQNSVINGRDVISANDPDLVCFNIFGYIFNSDNSLQRGVTCIESEEGDSLYLPPSDWTWSVDTRQVTLSYRSDNGYYTSRDRMWEVLSSDNAGNTVVLEYSIAELKSDPGKFPFFIRPRINYIKLKDLSQFEDIYANSGFGGDADGDGIEDGPDTDDDNDGMPDYYEESFSLNHLNSADRDEDLDGDGLTNFEEFTLGSYPNDSDSDNDGIPDGEDTSPVPVDKEARTAFDYDGDGISDIVIRRPEIGQFLVARSSDGTIMRAFFGSLGSDIPLAGDFDGDGTTDLAIRRPSVKQFISRTSSDDSINRIFFGSQDEDIPVIADYDGDGVDDIAIRRPSSGQWFIKYSSTGDIMRETFGTSTSDIPAVADYDGDGKADIAVRRQDAGQFIIKYSSTGEIDRIFFGSQSTDIPVPADYDGDGKADIAIRRPDSGFWFVKRSTDGVIERTFFGSLSDDIPVVADYDGDGKADIAIRRPASGTWVVKQSSDGSYTRLFFGSKTTDIPLAAPLNTVLGLTANDATSGSATELLEGFEIDRSETLIKEAISAESSWIADKVTSVD
ncbi:VCBS repeat-containing protein [Alteromonas sp. IB21]|uniref:FG-GAP repeat domain-containing protein n=1 Tax=Alteromonas sp. IB21 TaxID=2779369 RepID=UPI0018E8438A|nr:VCBS repeat-containing protein [Alteromonas sp. IB21]MBJ2128704.1 VCBS repeat-containing protein [Alteromonas sp. IB21]